jgi:histidine triad (HIT) family protein
MKECLFCGIAKGDIKAAIVHDSPEILAFRDINPKAPVHIIVIPRKHIERISDITERDSGLIGKLFLVAKDLAHENNIDASGYRVVANCNKDAGQEVYHLHLHLMGGRKFSWPPG